VPDDSDRREARVGAQPAYPSSGIVGVHVESHVGFADHRLGARGNTALVIPNGRDAALSQTIGEHLEAIVGAWKDGRVSVAVGWPGTGDDDDERHWTGPVGTSSVPAIFPVGVSSVIVSLAAAIMGVVVRSMFA
jgi:hypothetical protein